MLTKIQELLEQVGKDVLTSESKKAIAEAFDSAVAEVAAERAKLEVQNAITQIDEEHTAKLEKLLEAVDADHTKKLKMVVEKIDLDHTEKLKTIVKRYEKMLNEEAKKFRNDLVEKISTYMDLTIDRTIPEKSIAEAVENTSARKMIDEIKKIVTVDEDYITENIREALVDGKKQIDGLRNEVNEVLKENIKLNNQIKQANAALLIEKKTAHMPKEKREFVQKTFAGRSPEYITENFDYVVGMFNREQKEAKELIVESAKQSAVARDVDTPKASETLIHEDLENTPVNGYLNELETQDNRYRKGKSI